MSSSQLQFDHRDQWRAWLQRNHAIATAAWLVLFKKKYANEGLALDEAVEEALCFGWIDGQLQRLDQKCFLLRFSPRTADSIWSVSNIQRAEKLIGDGKMTPAGLAKIAEAQENGQWEAAIRREEVDRIPEDLESALQGEPGALPAYRALADSRKKQFLYWLQSAKRAETRRRRIQKIVEEVRDR